MEAYRELTRRVLAALVTTNPEAAAEAVGLLPSPRTAQRPPSPAEQEQEARQRFASLQSSMALLTGAMEVASPTSMPQTPPSRLQSPTTPHAARAQEQAAQHVQHQAQAQAAQQQQQQQQAHLQAVQQHHQAQAQTQASAPLQQQRQSAADATRERQVQAVRRQQQAHEVRGVQLARLLASLIAEGTEAQQQQQQQHAQVQAQQVSQPQQARTVASNQRAPLPSPTARAQHTQQAAQQATQQRPLHTRQHAAPRTGDSTQVSAPSRTLPHGPAYQCPALTQRAHSHDTTAAQHQRRQQQHHQQQQQQQQQQWAASQPGWGRTRYDNSSAMRSGYPCMMQPMLVPANSTWPYVVSMPVSYTMYG